MTGCRTLSIAMVVATGFAGVVGTGECVRAEVPTAEVLTIGAAYSLKAPFTKILPMFEREYGTKVQVVYGPSQTLRQQIEEGAPIDVFLSEGTEDVERLRRKELLLNGGPRIYAQTSLVLVMSTTSPALSISFGDGLRNPATRIALGDPKTTALGAVTTQALTKLGPAYKDRFPVLRARHSEDLVNLVHTGKADMGIVYRVDAINSGQVRIIDEAPAGTHTPVQFSGALVWTCRKASLGIAEQFVDFMLSPRMQKLLLQYGFDPVLSNKPQAEVRSN